MTDDTTPDTSEVQGDTATPDTGAPAQPEAGHDWEQRYNDLRPQYDRTMAQLKQVEPAQQWLQALQNPQTSQAAFQQLAQQLGYQVDGDTVDEDTEPPSDVVTRQEWEAFQAERAQQAQQEELAALEEDIWGQVDQAISQAPVQLPEGTRDMVYLKTLQLPAKQDGSPDVQGALEQITGWREQIIKGYRGTKSGAPAAPPRGGSSGEPIPSLKTPQDRLAAMNQIVAESQIDD